VTDLGENARDLPLSAASGHSSPSFLSLSSLQRFEVELDTSNLFGKWGSGVALAIQTVPLLRLNSSVSGTKLFHNASASASHQHTYFLADFLYPKFIVWLHTSHLHYFVLSSCCRLEIKVPPSRQDERVDFETDGGKCLSQFSFPEDLVSDQWGGRVYKTPCSAGLGNPHLIRYPHLRNRLPPDVELRSKAYQVYQLPTSSLSITMLFNIFKKSSFSRSTASKRQTSSFLFFPFRSSHTESWSAPPTDLPSSIYISSSDGVVSNPSIPATPNTKSKKVKSSNLKRILKSVFNSNVRCSTSMRAKPWLTIPSEC
jgi:hypothetical protein